MPVEFQSTGATEIVLRNRARAAHLLDLTPELDQASDLVYEATREWFDSAGGGTWPQLAESTIAQKISQGAAEPERALYREGNLYESVTSPSGPYSFRHHPDGHSVAIGADWDQGGTQIPVVLSEGTDHAGVGGHTMIPARPIWPDEEGYEATRMRLAIGELFLKGI